MNDNQFAANVYLLQIEVSKINDCDKRHDIPQIDAFTFNELQCALNILSEIQQGWENDGIGMKELVDNKIAEIKNLIK